MLCEEIAKTAIRTTQHHAPFPRGTTVLQSLILQETGEGKTRRGQLKLPAAVQWEKTSKELQYVLTRMANTSWICVGFGAYNQKTYSPRLLQPWVNRLSTDGYSYVSNKRSGTVHQQLSHSSADTNQWPVNSWKVSYHLDANHCCSRSDRIWGSKNDWFFRSGGSRRQHASGYC